MAIKYIASQTNSSFANMQPLFEDLMKKSSKFFYQIRLIIILNNIFYIVNSGSSHFLVEFFLEKIFFTNIL